MLALFAIAEVTFASYKALFVALVWFLASYNLEAFLYKSPYLI
jgi:hypothetical protein